MLTFVWARKQSEHFWTYFSSLRNTLCCQGASSLLLPNAVGSLHVFYLYRQGFIPCGSILLAFSTLSFEIHPCWCWRLQFIQLWEYTIRFSIQNWNWQLHVHVPLQELLCKEWSSWNTGQVVQAFSVLCRQFMSSHCFTYLPTLDIKRKFNFCQPVWNSWNSISLWFCFSLRKVTYFQIFISFFVKSSFLKIVLYSLHVFEY